jgi:hypothetical protein
MRIIATERRHWPIVPCWELSAIGFSERSQSRAQGTVEVR